MKPYGCHNRAPMVRKSEVQDGWTYDGRRNMVAGPVLFTRNCQYAAHGYGAKDERCDGCEWLDGKER